MDRAIIYPGQVPLETDLLNTNKNTMIAVAKLAAAMLGSSGVVVNGLACAPTSPAGLTVNVLPGEMYSLVATDATAYSSLASDSHTILKQGIALDAVNLSCPAPGTAGQSINYLIQAIYQDSDAGTVVLPYYNASNPSQAFSGPGNSGTAQPTSRKGIVTISAKAGIAATTGSQTTPAPDAGYTGLWVVTVANGQSTITSANITQAANAPILPTDLLHAIQGNALITANDTGSANTYAVSYSPAITALTDGMVLWFKAKTANTGASTLNVNGLGAIPLIGGAHSALQGGEIVANGKCQVVYRADINSAVLIECTGGALQVAAATQGNQVMQLGQFPAQAVASGLIKTVKPTTATVSGTYTPSAGMAFVLVEMVAGGGAGGGAPGVSSQGAAGGGGGGGGFGRRLYSAAEIGASQSYSIGSAGVGASGAAGGAGGNSTFGTGATLITCNGGAGGSASVSSSAVGAVGGGGVGGTTSGATDNIQGWPGSYGIGTGVNGGTGGVGGSSYFGTGGANVANASGNIATGAGAGGGGAGAQAASTAGGSGTVGKIRFTEFLTQ
ncbi:hypothetical protein [Cupriavidus numazuensis]|uniref:Uncharacterized protein n=1 Tax=Cupriavidus numazuensis TaxID=221992 RepID=A0ABN7PSU7_9BURK|nr:hypothetical protein [Cupriavidus numazuensis]CAG2136123.1 hypothetical protein LMG26411_01198 [Cupriavidus numazuensis]